MHLGQADLVGDLGLGESAEESQREDGAVAGCQPGQHNAQRFAIVDHV